MIKARTIIEVMGQPEELVAETLKKIETAVKEKMKVVKSFIENGGKIPDNLIIRLSAYMIDSSAPSVIAKQLGVYTSTVTKSDTFNCLAPQQNNKCGDCRRCWNKNISNISYHYH